MVWAGISTETKTALVMVKNGSLNGARYIEDILPDHVVPFGPFIGDGFLFMHDNARAHVAHAVSEYLDDVGIQRIRWPARSADLNPIEHAWDMLGRRVKDVYLKTWLIFVRNYWKSGGHHSGGNNCCYTVITEKNESCS